MTFRKTIFWLHLAAGLVAGLVIAVMCFTGAALAFEKDTVAFAERAARRISPPAAGAARLPLAELQKHLAAASPAVKASAIALENDPLAAVSLTVGRNESYYVNPYTGEVRRPASTKIRDFLHTLEDWHRVLALGGDQRAVGKAINGACNLAFFVLAVTGLYLWWPRKWRTKGLRRSLWFVSAANAKARDWNWHNVIGLWSAPVLIVLTLTALPISYRWAGDLIFTLTGTPLPPPNAPGGPPPASAFPPVKVTVPAPEARPLAPEALIAVAQHDIPTWTTLTYRAGSSPSSPATVAVRSADSWPRTATTTLTLDPFTGEILKRTGYADLNAAQRVRSWTRFLHTGEALGRSGQFFAGLACLGGLVLVYTGFALAWHRWQRWRQPQP